MHICLWLVRPSWIHQQLSRLLLLADVSGPLDRSGGICSLSCIVTRRDWRLLLGERTRIRPRVVSVGLLVLQEVGHWLLAGVMVIIMLRTVFGAGSALETQVPRRDQNGASVRLLDLVVLIQLMHRGIFLSNTVPRVQLVNALRVQARADLPLVVVRHEYLT